jgi:hypothetical protein
LRPPADPDQVIVGHHPTMRVELQTWLQSDNKRLAVTTDQQSQIIRLCGLRGFLSGQIISETLTGSLLRTVICIITYSD